MTSRVRSTSMPLTPLYSLCRRGEQPQSRRAEARAPVLDGAGQHQADDDQVARTWRQVDEAFAAGELNAEELDEGLVERHDAASEAIQDAREGSCLGCEMGGQPGVVQLGSGGTVVVRIRAPDVGFVAVKVVPHEEHVGITQLVNEVRILRSHLPPSPRIVGAEFFYHAQGHAMLGLEYCPGGDLLTLMEELMEKPSDASMQDKVRNVLRQVGDAVAHCHNHAVVHGDIKPENIVFDGSGDIKLIDFGVAVHLNPEEHLNPETGRLETVTSSGTLIYAPPEVLCRLPHGVESDWWNFGVLVCELVTGSPPWTFDVEDSADSNEATRILCDQICLAPLPIFPRDGRLCDLDHADDFLTTILDKNPVARLGFLRCGKAGPRLLQCGTDAWHAVEAAAERGAPAAAPGARGALTLEVGGRAAELAGLTRLGGGRAADESLFLGGQEQTTATEWSRLVMIVMRVASSKRAAKRDGLQTQWRLRVAQLVLLLPVLVLVLGARAGAAAAARGHKVARQLCCDPVGARASAQCGAAGLGFKWVGDDAGAAGLLRKDGAEEGPDGDDARDRDRSRAVLLLASAVTSTGYALPTRRWQRWRDQGDEGATLVRYAAAGAALVGLCVAQLRCTKVLALSPLGWMRVANVLTLWHICALLVVPEGSATVQDAATRTPHESIGLSRHGIFVVVAYAQEKLLWRPLLCNGIPLATALVIRILLQALSNGSVVGHDGRRATGVVGVGLAAGLAAITCFDSFSLAQADPESAWVSAPTRLFLATHWPVFALPLARVLDERLAQHAVFLVATALVLWMAAPGPDGRFFLRTEHEQDRRGRWCCFEPAARTRCGPNGVPWFHHHESLDTSGPWSDEIHAMMWITVLSNASGLPAVWHTLSTNKPFPAVIGSATVVFSTLYHLADTIDDRFGGMTEGNWHRLDNIFAILSFVSLQVYMLVATLSHAQVECVRACLVILTVLLQEIGPWKLECTLIPVLAAMLVAVVYLYHVPAMRASITTDAGGHFTKALVLLSLGVLGFIKGLDQDSDTLRIAHGCWHLFTGLSFFFFSRGLSEASAVPPPLADYDEDEDDAVEDEQQRAEAGQGRAEAEELVRTANAAVEKVKEEAEDVTKWDEMVAAANAAKALQKKRKEEKLREMDESFGEGLKQAMKDKLAKQKETKVVVEALKEQGNAAFKAGKLEEARQLYGKAIAKCGSGKWYEKEAALHSNRSLVNLKLGDAGAALDDAEAALESDPRWAKAHVRKALALGATGEHEQAQRCFERGIKTFEGRGSSSKDCEAIHAEYRKAYPEAYELFTLPTIGGPATKGTAGDNENSSGKGNGGLELPDVQQAMMMEKLNSGEWANESLMERIMKNPVLAKGMTDPRSAALLQRLQQDPNAAMKEFGTTPEARTFVQEMIKTLGEHFSSLGDEEDKRRVEAHLKASEPAIMTEEEAQLNKQAKEVLSNDRIRQLLSDPEMQRVLQECQTDPRRLAFYMAQPKWAERFAVLREHGLIRFQR
ncbi:Aurora kinase B (Aurora 1) (Aurora- and IPL1-like midbody-associated protein 1) (AIM-1) (Aurora/IPL1-related kinase 2) (ARK-2) (Aurora-related kinase 2) (STK-1) (Serine/threonine-protein kinase 12) (Serine/threonine-protein kinase 5) (Serine/threonine-protein kinase aurora-B) [Durusdinium trenchii]|uniref:Protein kinase domain-containing protein n=1 Tax=Durusdinium trenchii TaxID=1381693 RepID=A0ABP0HLA9_9DINO